MANDPEVNDGWKTFKQNDLEAKQSRGRGRPPKFQFPEKASASTDGQQSVPTTFSLGLWDIEEIQRKYRVRGKSTLSNQGYICRPAASEQMIQEALGSREFTAENIQALHRYLRSKDEFGFVLGGHGILDEECMLWLQRAGLLATPDPEFEAERLQVEKLWEELHQ